MGSRYTYEYFVRNFSLFQNSVKLKVRIGDGAFQVIGVAAVTVKVIDTTRPSDDSGSFEDFRYIFMNDKLEPDVSYKERRGTIERG